MIRLKRQIDGLYPAMTPVDGNPAIRQLDFPARLRDAFDMIGATEAAAVRVLSYFTEGEARDVLVEQLEAVGDEKETGRSSTGSWADVCDALISRLLNEDVLRESNDAFTLAVQRDGEDEATFADRLSKATRRCRNVFTKAEVVNYFIQGLKPSVREAIAHLVRQLSEADNRNFAIVSQTAISQGKSHRHLLEEGRKQEPPVKLTSRSAKKEPEGKKVVPQSALLIPPSPDCNDETPGIIPPIGAVDDEEALRIALALEQVLFAGRSSEQEEEGPSAEMMKTLISDGERPVLRDQAKVPNLTDHQVRQALTVIPTDYWALSCWTCREDGHSAFRCPYLTADQRLHFAYHYYLYQ